ncbi:MAG: uracil-DNA glycosylase [Caldicoprobacterales bacterium]|jgi:uracil-DNA glycosylase|nr:uracil-DNA glycosylase [Bacillota bacterium]NLH58256.1 uracil-DNA glycosylase [Clostridiales bacterium]
MVRLDNDWDELLESEFKSDYYQRLRQFLKKEYSTKVIYPDMYKIFEALRLTSYADTRVVILGQDPYHGPKQAHGLAFSVQKGIAIPPSLLNIYKELESDCGCYIPNNGYLVPWADQGVLLLNASLTVVAGQANSHRGMGWEIFTDSIIKRLNKKESPLVFLLWGNKARAKASLVDNPNHLILASAHPSPLSAHRGFFGCKHFSKANSFLKERGLGQINWQIPNL